MNIELLLQLHPPKGTLLHYLKWILSNPIPRIPLYEAVGYVGGVTKVLWHREGQFQTQMFVMPPNYIIPEHTHPNVDSFEVYLGGQISFSHSGYFVVKENTFNKTTITGENVGNWSIVQVNHNDKHGGVIGEHGGVFLSVQKWLNGVKPHCVACDYEGQTMNQQHLESVKYGEATCNFPYSITDAASKEVL